MRTTFRFETLNVWQRAADASLLFFGHADRLERVKQFRFAEQLRSAMLSVTNNIAEGSGSVSNREFAQFINIARRSVFEVVNMLVMFERHGLVKVEESAELLTELEGISKMLEAFRKKLANTLRSVAVIAVGFILIAFCF
jgi:four helix bundle protein